LGFGFGRRLLLPAGTAWVGFLFNSSSSQRLHWKYRKVYRRFVVDCARIGGYEITPAKLLFVGYEKVIYRNYFRGHQ
jgi:hypothetical protein